MMFLAWLRVVAVHTADDGAKVDPLNGNEGHVGEEQLDLKM